MPGVALNQLRFLDNIKRGKSGGGEVNYFETLDSDLILNLTQSWKRFGNLEKIVLKR